MSNRMLRINSLSFAVGLAVAIPGFVVSDDAQAAGTIAATHIYHNHMPNFWPYYNTADYEKAAVGDPIRYAYDGQVYRIKEKTPADYTYFLPKKGTPMPHDNLQQYYDRDAKRNAYTVWPAQTARANSGAHPLSQTQVTMSAAVINNVQSFAELNIFDFFREGWSSDWKSTVGSLKTTNGFNALEPIHFTGHHSMGPLVGPRYFLKDLIYQNVTLQRDYFLGADKFRSSKGFFPTELGFSERLIPTLTKLGIEWSVVGNNHFSRTLKDYPYNYKDPSYDTLVSPPNRADLQNTYEAGEWVRVGMAHEQQQIVNKFPFCDIPHWVQYVDPVTGKADKIAAIPVDQNGSWLEGWEGEANAHTEIERSNYVADANGRTMYYVIAHDGDNGEGRAGSISTWLASGSEYIVDGVVGMGVQEYLKAYPIPESDIQHIQDGSWVDTRDSSSDPDWYHWHIPMGVWKGQLSDFNKALGTEFELPVNFAGTPMGHAVSMEYGYHYLERNFALLQAAENYAVTAEQIWLDDHPNYWSPSTDAEKQVTYEGNQLNPYMMSYPVKGDEQNDYRGGANPAELGWYFLISSIDSGFGYYDENTDDNVKPSLGFNQSLYFTEPYVTKNAAKDKTGPSMWWVQRYPTNPGSANSGKAEGWTPMYADNTFAVYTYAYDVSGIKDVKVYVRAHKNKSMGPTDIAPRVYDPKALGISGDAVGEWKVYDTKVRDLTPDMNGVAWQDNEVSLNYKVIPAKKIASTYYAYISDFRDQLVDYYMEATDTRGNVTRSEINHTYVGAGRYNLVDGAYIEDVNGEIEGSHMFFTDGSVVLTDSVTVYARAGDESVTSVYLEHKDKGTSDWNSVEMKKVGDTTYFKTTVSYTRDATCADIRVRENGGSYYNGNSGTCLSKGTYVLGKDGSITEGAPTDIVTPVTFYFKPASSLTSVCVHYRGTPQTGDKGWTAVPGAAMTAQKNGWWSYTDTESFGAEISGLEFLFNDCGNSWYKSSSNGNFVLNSVGDVWVDGTKMGTGTPAELDNSNKAPTAVISASSLNIKQGESVTLDASGSTDSDGSIVSYKWNTGETSSKITVTPDETTVYTVTVTDNDGATATKSVTVNVEYLACAVDPFWYLQADFLASVQGGTVNLTDNTYFGERKNCTSPVTSTGVKVSEQCLETFGSGPNCGLVYSWDFGDGSSSSETFSVSHTYQQSGTYNVVLKISRNGSATDVHTVSKNITVDVPQIIMPVAKISADKTEINRGETLVLKGTSSTGNELSYLWSTGETTSSITVQPEATTVYTLTVTDKNGNTSEKASVTITVKDVVNHAPGVSVVTSADNVNRTVKSGTTVTLDASGSADEDNDQLTFLWSNGKTGAVITENLYETTRFTVEVSDGKNVSTGAVTITVVDDNAAPIARISIAQTGAVEGTEMIFDGSSSTDDKAVKKYEWAVNGTKYGTNSSFTHKFETAGTYVVTLTVYDEEGLSGSQAVTVFIVAAEEPVVEFTISGSTNVNINETAVFTTSLVNAEASSYSWYIDGEKVNGSQSSLSHQFTVAGTHEVKVVVTDKKNVQHQAVKQITVNNPYVSTPVKVESGSQNQTKNNEIRFVQSDSDDRTPVSIENRKIMSFVISNISHEATVQVVRLPDQNVKTSGERVCQIFSGYVVDCDATDGVDYNQFSNDATVDLKFIQAGSYEVRIKGKNLAENDFSGYIPVSVTEEENNNGSSEEEVGSTPSENTGSSSGKKGGGAIGLFDLILMAGAGFFVRRRRK